MPGSHHLGTAEKLYWSKYEIGGSTPVEGAWNQLWIKTIEKFDGPQYFFHLSVRKVPSKISDKFIRNFMVKCHATSWSGNYLYVFCTCYSNLLCVFRICDRCRCLMIYLDDSVSLRHGNRNDIAKAQPPSDVFPIRDFARLKITRVSLPEECRASPKAL